MSGFQREDLRGFDKGSRQVGGRAALWIIGILLFSALIGGVTWGANVLLSDPKGKGDAIIAKNSAANRVAKQEKFETLYAKIVAADQGIAVAAAELKVAPEDSAVRTRYFGSIQFCQGLIADYDAEARKFSSQDFRAGDLPYQIGESPSPSTDCAE